MFNIYTVRLYNKFSKFLIISCKSKALIYVILKIWKVYKSIKRSFETRMKIYESAENYLETILMLKKKHENVRSIDIVNELEYTKPSVSVAMKNLRENGYIEMDEKGFIELTDKGRRIAETIYERHKFLSDWLMDLGVDEKTATEDACRIEHVISPESFEAIKRHVEDTSKKE